MESERKAGYWKTMCSTLEAENHNLRKKIKFVVRLIRQKNKKLKKVDKEMDKREEEQSSSLVKCGGGGGGGGGERKKIMENERNNEHVGCSLPPARQAFQILHEEVFNYLKYLIIFKLLIILSFYF